MAWAAGLARGLKHLGHDVTLIYIRDSPFFPMFESELADLDVECTFRGFAAWVSKALGWPISLAFLGGGYGKEGTPDPLSWILAPFLGRWGKRFDLLVFAEDFTGLAGFATNQLTEIPYAVFVHEAAGGEPERMSYRVIEKVRKTIRRRATLTCAIDDAIAERLEKYGEPHVVTVPLGCDPIPQAVLTRASFVIADSRWTPARDPAFILEIAKRTPGVPYLMLGSFWTPETERAFLRQRQRLGLESQVTMMPNITSRDATALYQRAMVYIRWAAQGTGGWEMGFPTGLRIAMSNACPILFDRNLGCASFIGSAMPECAVEHNPEAYVEKILDLTRSAELVRARSVESLNFAKKYPWSYSASRMLQALPSDR